MWVSGKTLTLQGGCKPRLSLFMVCVTYAGPSLGVFDTSKAMDLGLPAIDAASGPVGHNGVGAFAPVVSSVLTPVRSGSGT